MFSIITTVGDIWK